MRIILQKLLVQLSRRCPLQITTTVGGPDSLLIDLRPKTLMDLTKGGTEYPPGSLFMDVEDIPFEELLSLASDKSYWKALVAGL